MELRGCNRRQAVAGHTGGGAVDADLGRIDVDGPNRTAFKPRARRSQASPHRVSQTGIVLARGLAIDETWTVRIPEVHYARSGDIAIAYQVVGDGRPDIIFVRAIAGDLLSTWEQPLLVRQLDVFASCGRLLMLDKRGTGLSDRVREVHAVETAMDDIRAVMDEANSERAVLWTGTFSTGIGVLFAATYPDRCSGLVLFDPRAKGTQSPDYPWAPTEEEWRDRLAAVRAGWGERWFLEDLAREWAPEVAGDEGFRDWFVWHMRRSLSPGAAMTAFCAAMELDVRDILPTVRVPTLVFPRPMMPEAGRYVAEHIKDAEVVALPDFGGVYTWTDDNVHETAMEATKNFVSRLEHRSETNRVLATILFTDIVGSTELMSRLGVKDPEFFGGSRTRRRPGGRRCYDDGSPEEVSVGVA